MTRNLELGCSRKTLSCIIGTLAYQTSALEQANVIFAISHLKINFNWLSIFLRLFNCSHKTIVFFSSQKIKKVYFDFIFFLYFCTLICPLKKNHNSSLFVPLT